MGQTEPWDPTDIRALSFDQNPGQSRLSGILRISKRVNSFAVWPLHCLHLSQGAVLFLRPRSGLLLQDKARSVAFGRDMKGSVEWFFSDHFFLVAKALDIRCLERLEASVTARLAQWRLSFWELTSVPSAKGDYSGKKQRSCLRIKSGSFQNPRAPNWIPKRRAPFARFGFFSGLGVELYMGF